MKTVIRVFTIIGMVCLPIAFLIFDLVWGFAGLKACQDAIANDANSFGGASAQDVFTVVLVVAIVFTVVICLPGEIVGALSLKKIGVATSKSQLIALGVLEILFTSVVAGICMLAIPSSQLEQK
jgi:hypothetical protein